MLKIGYNNVKLGGIRFDERRVEQPENAAAAGRVDDSR
jgi:hypothetical protein